MSWVFDRTMFDTPIFHMLNLAISSPSLRFVVIALLFWGLIVSDRVHSTPLVQSVAGLTNRLLSLRRKMWERPENCWNAIECHKIDYIDTDTVYNIWHMVCSNHYVDSLQQHVLGLVLPLFCFTIIKLSDHSACWDCSFDVDAPLKSGMHKGEMRDMPEIAYGVIRQRAQQALGGKASSLHTDMDWW